MSTTTLGLPVQQGERITILDVLRGIALFGVLISNLHAIIFYTTPPVLLARVSGSIDGVLEEVQSIFIDWKFMSLFAMLFGYGFGLLLRRLEVKGIGVGTFFTRRMGLLFAMGLVNLCFWWADILHVYALAGLALLLFRRAPNRSLLMGAAVFAIVLPYFMVFVRKAGVFIPVDLAVLQAVFPYFKSHAPLDIIQGNYLVSLACNRMGLELDEWLHAMGCILFGYWVLRKNVFDRLGDNRANIWKAWGIGLACLVVPYVFFETAIKQGWLEHKWVNHISFPLYKASVFGPGVFYAASVILLYQSGSVRGIFRLFAHVGRLSLTNYLLQSVLYVFLFYGVGFNKLGEIPVHKAWLIGTVFYLVQVVFSAWWMKHFHFGPAEWIWRQLSYGSRFPIRRYQDRPRPADITV